MTAALSDPVVRTFRIPRDLYVRIAESRGLESLNGEVVRRLEASFRKPDVTDGKLWVPTDAPPER